MGSPCTASLLPFEIGRRNVGCRGSFESAHHSRLPDQEGSHPCILEAVFQCPCHSLKMNDTPENGPRSALSVTLKRSECCAIGDEWEARSTAHTDNLDEDEWALMLSNPQGEEEGYIAIAPKEDGRWAIRVVLSPPISDAASEEVFELASNVPTDVEFAGYDKLEQTFATLEEAKRKADRLLGWDSCEIPHSRDSDPKWSSWPPWVLKSCYRISSRRGSRTPAWPSNRSVDAKAGRSQSECVFGVRKLCD